jgi:hypothetical protein
LVNFVGPKLDLQTEVLGDVTRTVLAVMHPPPRGSTCLACCWTSRVSLGNLVAPMHGLG